MSNGVVPRNMKIAKVVPIFKKGDPQLLTNYRPISLLSSFSKILEKLVYIRVIKFFNKTNIFSHFQFGFRAKHTTTHAILHFIDKIGTALDNHLHTIGIYSWIFRRPLILLIIEFCLLNYPIMGSEVLPWSGLEAISQIGNNLFL